MKPDLGTDVVCLMRIAQSHEAHIVGLALQAAGIPCRVVGDYLFSCVGDIPPVTAELWVRKRDLERAKEIVAAARENAAKVQENSDQSS
jgi:hypothetical protein